MGYATKIELPFELTADALVALGPDYARVLVRGQKGASNVVHITPLGHTELSRRIREHAKGS